MKLSSRVGAFLIVAASIQLATAFLTPSLSSSPITFRSSSIAIQHDSQLLMSSSETETKVETKEVTKNQKVNGKRNGKKGKKQWKKKTAFKKGPRAAAMKNKKGQKNNKKSKNSKKGKRTKKFSKIDKSVSPNTKLLPLSDLKLGSKIDGHVAAFTAYGIFIKTKYDFKGKGGNGYALLHKSQIRDEPVEDMSKLFRIGAKVKGLRAIKVNYAKGEVGVSLRTPRAGRKDLQEIPIGQEIEGTVSKVVPYGAFVDVGANVNALVHISRISQIKIRNIQNVISVGEKVHLHILSKDLDKKTMAGSMLDEEADMYLDRRTEQMKEMSQSVKIETLKTELEYFEEAVRELEESLGDDEN